jgi:hypothetical protein
MVNHINVKNDTGVVAIATTLAPAQSFRLKEVRVHLSAAGGAGNFTATVDAINGAAYDLNIITQDMTAVVDYIWQPDTSLQFEPGDEIDFAWANANGRTYGLTIVYELL